MSATTELGTVKVKGFEDYKVFPRKAAEECGFAAATNAYYESEKYMLMKACMNLQNSNKPDYILVQSENRKGVEIWREKSKLKGL